ncbi:MAG: hypothetical protein MZV49_24490 [Rhodopseudomonas palustris]|nr:hypothetical protein [Rhodopseudomonas palustris]
MPERGSRRSAQVAPISYWIPGGLYRLWRCGHGACALTYGDFPGTGAAAGEQRSGFSFRSYEFQVNSFAGGYGWNGIGGYSNFSALTREGAQLNYDFKGVGNLPMALIAGVDALKYKPDVFNSLTGSGTESTAAYGFHAGVEVRPTSNLSLSVSAGYVQPNGRVDSDIRSSLLPGESPMFAGGRRSLFNSALFSLPAGRVARRSEAGPESGGEYAAQSAQSQQDGESRRW